MLRYHSGQFGKHALYITFSLIVFLQMTLAHYNHGVKIHNWASVENIFVWSIAWRYHYTTRVFDKYLTTCGFNCCYIQRVYLFKVHYKFVLCPLLLFAESLDAGIIIIKIVSPKFHHIGPLLAFIRTISVPNTWEPDMLFLLSLWWESMLMIILLPHCRHLGMILMMIISQACPCEEPMAEVLLFFTGAVPQPFEYGWVPVSFWSYEMVAYNRAHLFPPARQYTYYPITNI